MKKLYLKDMEREKQFKILIKNEKLLQQFRNRYYNDMMELQWEFTKNIYEELPDDEEVINYILDYCLLDDYYIYNDNDNKIYLDTVKVY